LNDGAKVFFGVGFGLGLRFWFLVSRFGFELQTFEGAAAGNFGILVFWCSGVLVF
jgi:hypothetical protein